MPVREPITTPALRLRRFVRDDAPSVLALSREDAAAAWLPSQIYRDLEHATAVVEFLIAQYGTPGDPRRGPFVLAIEHAADGVLVGHVGLSPLDDDVEIGFAIAEAYQGRGLATEAVSAATRWAFGAYALPRIVGITAADNLASQRTLLRAGFVHETDRVMMFQGTERGVRVYKLKGGS